MSADIDKLMRAIYVQVELAKDLQSLKAQIKAIVGEENVAIVLKSLQEQEK